MRCFNRSFNLAWGGPQEQITSLMEFICSEQLGHRIGEKQIENDRNIMTYGHDCCDTNDERVTQE